jgi:hypothetical protein
LSKVYLGTGRHDQAEKKSKQAGTIKQRKSQSRQARSSRGKAGRHDQSHLPSFQPVLHRCSHVLQSKDGLPSLTLTALWASHIHWPKSCLLLTRGSLPALIHALKSSAHTQQGYIFPNRCINVLVSFCCVGEGFSG